MYKLKLFFIQSIVFATIVTILSYNGKGKGNTIYFEKRNRRNIQINKLLQSNENYEKQSDKNNERLLSTVNALNVLQHPINIYSPEYVTKRQQITLTRNTRTVSADQQVVKRGDNLGHDISLDRKFNKVVVKLDKSTSKDITTDDNFNRNDSASLHKFQIKKKVNHTHLLPPQKHYRNLRKNKSGQFSKEKALNQPNVNPYIPSTFRTDVYPFFPGEVYSYLPGQVYPYLPGQEVYDSAYNLSFATKFHNKFDKKFGAKLDISPSGDITTKKYSNNSGSESQDNFLIRTGHEDHYSPKSPP